jgi:DNA helicase-2/ATP-dependent DNA helicase PcrA
MALNEQQEAIVSEIRDGEGSLIVQARAGCGKTFTLVEGVVKTIVDEKMGSAVLMAFNKSAATEFEARIERMGDEYTVVSTGTVHSLGFGAWRRNKRVKVDGYKVWNLIRNHENENPVYKEFGAQINKLVSFAKQAGIGIVCPMDDWDAYEELIAHYDIDANGSADAIIVAAMAILKESNEEGNSIVDFDDMIYLPLLHNVSLPKFDFVLIDEAQDTNVTRRMLAIRMMKPNARLVAVGDDKQAIYGFAGANSDSLDLIRNELNAKVLPLSITYRCPQAVVAEANKLVPDLMAHETAPMGVVRRIKAVSEI